MYHFKCRFNYLFIYLSNSSKGKVHTFHKWWIRKRKFIWLLWNINTKKLKVLFSTEWSHFFPFRYCGQRMLTSTVCSRKAYWYFSLFIGCYYLPLLKGSLLSILQISFCYPISKCLTHFAFVYLQILCFQHEEKCFKYSFYSVTIMQ